MVVNIKEIAGYKVIVLRQNKPRPRLGPLFSCRISFSWMHRATAASQLGTLQSPASVLEAYAGSASPRGNRAQITRPANMSTRKMHLIHQASSVIRSEGMLIKMSNSTAADRTM